MKHDYYTQLTCGGVYIAVFNNEELTLLLVWNQKRRCFRKCQFSQSYFKSEFIPLLEYEHLPQYDYFHKLATAVVQHLNMYERKAKRAMR